VAGRPAGRLQWARRRCLRHAAPYDRQHQLSGTQRRPIYTDTSVWTTYESSVSFGVCASPAPMAWPPSSPRLLEPKLRTRTRTEQRCPEALAARKVWQRKDDRVSSWPPSSAKAMPATRSAVCQTKPTAERSDDGYTPTRECGPLTQVSSDSACAPARRRWPGLPPRPKGCHASCARAHARSSGTPRRQLHANSGKETVAGHPGGRPPARRRCLRHAAPYARPNQLRNAATTDIHRHQRVDHLHKLRQIRRVRQPGADGLASLLAQTVETQAAHAHTHTHTQSA
jgi:hypothetical protein